MKTRAKTFMKMVLMTSFLSLIAISCGKKNTSGGDTPNPYGTYTYPGVTGQNGINLPANFVQILASEYPCNIQGANGHVSQNRRTIRIPLQAGPNSNVSAGALHVGVSLAGDIGIVSNQGGQPVLELLACERGPDMTNEAREANYPGLPPTILDFSSSCAVDKINAANIEIRSSYQNAQPYLIRLAALDYIQQVRPTQLCR